MPEHSSHQTFERVVQPRSIAAERLAYGHSGPLGSVDTDWDGNTVDPVYADLHAESEIAAILKLQEEMDWMGAKMTKLVMKHIDPSQLRGVEMHFPQTQ